MPSCRAPSAPSAARTAPTWRGARCSKTSPTEGSEQRPVTAEIGSARDSRGPPAAAATRTGHSVSALTKRAAAVLLLFRLLFVCGLSALPVGTPCCFALWPLPPVVTVHGAALPAQAAACCALVRTAHLLAEEGAVGQNLQALRTVEDLAGQRRPIRDSAGRSGIAVKCSGARQETFKGTQRGYMLCAPSA